MVRINKSVRTNDQRSTAFDSIKHNSITAEVQSPPSRPWLPSAEHPKSKSSSRQKSVLKQGPHNITVPSLNEKRNIPFEIKDSVLAPIGNNLDRKSYDNQAQFKLNKLRNTYKPLINGENKDRRPISIQLYPQIKGQ